MAGIRTKLWQGMHLTSTTYAAWVDVYGYDFSLGHCIQRSAIIGDAERLKQPTEMACSLFWAHMDTTIADHNELLISFRLRICKKFLNHLLHEKRYFLDGWSENEFKRKVPSPAYKPSDYKACFPCCER